MIARNNITKAMILAAGEGTRLRPLTLKTPKPLLPVGGVPIAVLHLNWLRNYGVTDIAINLYHMGDKIEKELGTGSQFGMNIHYSREEKLLGTAGGLKRMEKLFDNTFFVVYGDVLTDINLLDMAKFHKEKKAVMTIALLKVANPWEKGIVELANDSKLLSFTEKPPRGTERSNLSNSGIYILESEIFNYIPESGFYDFGYDVLPKLIANNMPVYGYIIKPDDYLIDIGTIEKYQQANEDIKSGKVKIVIGKR